MFGTALAARALWGLGTGSCGYGRLCLARDIRKDEQIPRRLKVPVKSEAGKPAAKKRAGKQAAQSASASSSNPQRVRELKAVWTRKMKWKVECGHAHNGTIMFQWDSHYRRFACTAAVSALPLCGGTERGWHEVRIVLVKSNPDIMAPLAAAGEWTVTS